MLLEDDLEEEDSVDYFTALKNQLAKIEATKQLLVICDTPEEIAALQAALTTEEFCKLAFGKKTPAPQRPKKRRR